MLRPWQVALLATAVLVVCGIPSSALATPVGCARHDAQTGICLVEATSPSQGSDASTPPAGAGSGTENGSDGGSVQQSPCTLTLAQPQPAPTSAVWDGRSPADGDIYVQICSDNEDLKTLLTFLPNGLAPPAPPVDPRVLAEQAIASLVLRAPEIRMAPPPGSSGGLVGVPVWMWTERRSDLLGPARQSVTAGAVTVAAVAQVSRIAWDMGDGTTVLCGAGTPYTPGTQGASPDCGHVYAHASDRHVPGGLWPVTATSTWTITWTGGGLSGTETLELTSTTQLFVGELHVLNQDGSD